MSEAVRQVLYELKGIPGIEIVEGHALVAFTPEEAVHDTVKQWFGPVNIEGYRELPPGPWSTEPKKVQWVDRHTNLPCLIVRNPIGALCGYAGVYEGHPLYKQGYSDPEVSDISVHGGLTFAGPCMKAEDHSEFVCHIPEPGTSDDVWWFGFDCAHWNDLMPGMLALREIMPKYDVGLDYRNVYRDMDYVKHEVATLARQLQEIGAGVTTFPRTD